MIEQLATSLGINSDEPNIKLAESLIKKNDIGGIGDIVNGLQDRNKSIQSDCIKVLYEIGYRKPELISKYVDTFIDLLKSKNNRLVWGSTIALSTISQLESDKIFKKFNLIYEIYENGSVITIDNCISIFAGIAKSNKEHEKKVLPLLVDHFTHCRPKEIPQHFERAGICLDTKNSKKIVEIIQNRYSELSDSQKKRVDKVLKKIR